LEKFEYRMCNKAQQINLTRSQAVATIDDRTQGRI